MKSKSEILNKQYIHHCSNCGSQFRDFDNNKFKLVMRDHLGEYFECPHCKEAGIFMFVE